MSESDQMFLFVKIDDTEFDRQTKKLQESLNKVGTAFSNASRPAVESIKQLQKVDRSFTDTAKGIVGSVGDIPPPASRDFDKNVPRITSADVERNQKPQTVMQSSENMKPAIQSVQAVIDKLTQGLAGVLSKIPKLQKSVEPMRAVASRITEIETPMERIAPKMKSIGSTGEQIPKPASADFDRNVPRLTPSDFTKKSTVSDTRTTDISKSTSSIASSVSGVSTLVKNIQNTFSKISSSVGESFSKITSMGKVLAPITRSAVGANKAMMPSGANKVADSIKPMIPMMRSFGSTGENIPKPASADFDKNVPRLTSADFTKKSTTTDDTSKSTSSIANSVSSVSTLVKNIQTTFGKITSSVSDSFTKVSSVGKVLEPIKKSVVSAGNAGKAMTGGSRDITTLTNLTEGVEPMRKASAGMGKTMSNAMQVAKVPSIEESIKPLLKSKAGIGQAVSGITETAKPVADTAQKFDKLITGSEAIKKTVENTGKEGIEKDMRGMEKSAKGMSGIFSELKSIGGGILPLLGIGASIASIAALIVQSSPLLRSIFSILNMGIMFMLRPIGDFIGFLLRPVAIMFLRFAIQFYKDVFPTIKAIGSAGGAALAKFFTDPVGALAGLGLWIVQSFMSDAGIVLIKDGITAIDKGISDIVTWFSGGIGNIGETITGAFEGFSWPTFDFEWPVFTWPTFDWPKFDWPKLPDIEFPDLGKVFDDSKPDWMDKMLNFVWPGRPDWLDDLIGWVMPVMLVPGWIQSLVDGTWEWPKVPEWVTKLVNWLFPGVPQAIETLLTWEWPKIELPKWLKDFLGIKDEPEKKGIADTRTEGEKKSDAKGLTNIRSEELTASNESIRKMKESFGIVTESSTTISNNAKQMIEPSWKAVSTASKMASVMANAMGGNMISASSALSSAAKKIAKMKEDIEDNLKPAKKKTAPSSARENRSSGDSSNSKSKTTMDIIKETANRGISLANKFAGTNIRQLAKGGIISEFIEGVGASGKKYTFGEDGDEVIIPMTKIRTIVENIQSSSRARIAPINNVLRNGMAGAQLAMRNDISNVSNSGSANNTKNVTNHVALTLNVAKIDSQIDVDRMIERVMKEVYVMLSGLKS